MISTAILHAPQSPERAANLRDLLAAIPHATVIADDGQATAQIANRRGCWPLARRGWLAATGAHHLVLEDDAQLCSGFLDQLATLIAARPDACLSLFRGASPCSVATVMPATVIPRWLAWVDQDARGSRWLPHHDYLIDAGMRALGVPHLYAEPSIVEHRALASLLGHRHVRAVRWEQSPASVTLGDEA